MTHDAHISRSGRTDRSPDDRDPSSPDEPNTKLARRDLLVYSAVFGSALLAERALARSEDLPGEPQPSKGPSMPDKKYDMKKSINLWAFPYPDGMSLAECFALAKDAGFDGVELNFDERGEFSAESTDADLARIAGLARKSGIAVSGVCSFLFWPYSMTANDPAKRAKGIELAGKMIHAAGVLGVRDLLVVPGATFIPWVEDSEPVPNDVCDRRAREAVARLIPLAEKAGVSLNIENIFVSGFLFSPQEMVRFVDGFKSRQVGVHFDTGNIMQYQFPEFWIPMLGRRIRNVHLKEFDKRTGELNINTFRTLLDGTTNWPAVMAALDGIGYRGFLTFEYFHPFAHWPEALIYQTSDAIDRMLGRK